MEILSTEGQVTDMGFWDDVMGDVSKTKKWLDSKSEVYPGEPAKGREKPKPAPMSSEMRYELELIKYQKAVKDSQPGFFASLFGEKPKPPPKKPERPWF